MPGPRTRAARAGRDLSRSRSRLSWLWPVLLGVLLLVRIPSFVQPAGGDQGLYGYAGTRILESDVMYRDMWDQKPPGIAFTYALLWRIWPHESLVPAADLAIAAIVAVMLIVIGRRRFTPAIGYGAAALFLLLGDPYLQRMSGVFVRAQCEPFIFLAVTASLLLLSAQSRGWLRLFACGVLLGSAFWLKYNAGTYLLTAVVALAAWRQSRDPRGVVRDAVWMAAGFAALSVVILFYFAFNGALRDLWLATVIYNLHYANETYEGPLSRLVYLVTFPVTRVRVDPIWFVGAIGAALLLWRERLRPSTAVIFAWLAAAALSIAINGSRSLPNYFVQAFPALALAGSAGLATLSVANLLTRVAVGALLVTGFCRVGSNEPVMGVRLGGAPGLLENVGHDLRYMLGRTDRDTYLARFSGRKHDALENEKLVRYITATTTPNEPIYVFGFSGGSVCWKSGRQSSSRFFWSHPVIIEFAADVPGYGSAGLLRDLRVRPPAVVALQREEWHSEEHFLANSALRTWLLASYAMEYETPSFSVWRRKS